MILKQGNFNGIDMFKEWRREGYKKISYEMASTRKKKTMKT
jgi:hypothetical protein